MQKKYDIAIIGSGVVGSMLAYKLSSYGLNIALIDRANDGCEGISKANSGVLHAGFNVPTGTLKAKLNVEGLKLYPKILKKLKIPYKRCKKLVIAFNETQKKELKRLLLQGRANGCRGLKIIDKKKIKKINPKVHGLWALYSPRTAIVSPYQLTTLLAENAVINGVHLYLKSEVTAIKGSFQIELNNDKIIESNYLINCAGINATKVAKLFDKIPYETYPCKGEYYILDKRSADSLDLAIYPVPLKDGKSLGVHLTPTLNGNILIGPSAEYQDNHTDLSNRATTMEKLKEEAYKLLPDLKKYSFIKNYAGLRPKLKPQGFSDFVIEPSPRNPKMINLMGIESPGLTAAPAIAQYVISNFLKLKNTQKRTSKRFPPISPRSLHFARRKKIVNKNPALGDIICRCENISRQEIQDALNNPLGSKTISSIKKRTHATMGRCQGSFCLSRITEIMSKELSPKEILKTDEGSHLFEKYRHE